MNAVKEMLDRVKTTCQNFPILVCVRPRWMLAEMFFFAKLREYAFESRNRTLSPQPRSKGHEAY